jgi:GDP-4-dehydro-6-deoxy-D-mannose reductase
MRALVTGVNGFVGGHLVDQLHEHGDVVVGLSLHTTWPPGRETLAQSVRLEPCDLATVGLEALTDLVGRKKPEAIYHLAAQSNPQASLADPQGTWSANLLGTLNLLEAVKAAKLTPLPRIVLVGTGVSYGNPAPEFLPVTEACPVRPNNPYAASKAAVDLLGVQNFLTDGLPVLMARPFNHSGPGQADLYALSSFAKQVAEIEAGRRARIEVGNLNVVRDFTDVRDIVRAYRLLVERGRAGEIYNIGSTRDVSLAAMLEVLRGLARTPIEVHVDPARLRPVDQPRLLADASKLKADTGWEPRYSIEQTLADMLNWWRERLAATTA